MGFYPGYNETEQNQFDRLGHPGKWIQAVEYDGTQLDFTGSMYGFGGIIIGDPATNADIYLSGGGIVNTRSLLATDGANNLLATGNIIELSVAKIAAGNGQMTVLKRQLGF